MKHEKISSSITSNGVTSIRTEDLQKQTSFTELENDISSFLVPVSSKTPDYVELKKRIKRKGLLEKQPTYYACKILFTLGMLGLSLIFLTVLDNFYLQLVSAICLAFVQTQIGLIAHDAGHRQISSKTWKNDLIGFI